MKKEGTEMIIAVGSKNPAKVSAIAGAADSFHPDIITIDAPSGVSPQPFSDEETIQGAINRAVSCLKMSDADVGIGLEGGVVETVHGLFLCNWGALVDRKHCEDPIIAGGARIPLPKPIASELLKGRELGPVMSEFTKKRDIRKKEGAIGIFTDEWVSRSEMFSHVAKMLFGQYAYRQKQLKQ